MSGTSIKILIIASEFPPDAGGIGNHTYNLALHLSKHYGVSVVADIVTSLKEKVEEINKDLPFAFHPVYRRKPVILTYTQRILKTLQHAKQHDIIICSGKFSLWLMHLLKLFNASKKYIAIVHGTELLLTNKIKRSFTFAALQKTDAIIAVSNFTKNLLGDKLLKIIPVTVIHNGINNAEFARNKKDVLHKSFNAESVINLITIGSITERKGQQNVIIALPYLIKHFPNIHYHVVGKQTAYTKSNELVNTHQLHNQVTFYGMVERSRLIELLNNADMKMMLSANTLSGDVEGFGIAVLEANASGKPAIGSSGNGLEDAIKNNVTGKLVDANNPKEVLEAMLDILNNYNHYATNALQWAREHDWNILINQYIAIIDNVARKN